MHVVIDTNIFISGLFFGGTSRKVLDLVEKKEIIPCFITFTFSELERVLQQKKFFELREVLPFSVDSFLEKLKSMSLFFPQILEAPTVIGKDKADNYILACALLSQSNFIVSGDKHLLSLKSFQGISILTPKEFLGRFKRLRRLRTDK